MNPTDLPTVTVIVPVHNGVDLLRDCLELLRTQDYPATLVDVVVVDNNSTENIASVVPDDPRFTLLHESRRGSYAARNTGLTAARGRVIAFTDADCAPHVDWLTEGVRALREEPRADMVAGAIQLAFEHGGAHTGSELFEAAHSFRQDWYLAQRQFGATANVLTWRSTLDAVGDFDASLQSRGDAQWGRRVAAAGLRQRYAAACIVEHPARASWSELMTKQLRVARGHRDVDLADDPRVRHFMGVAVAHARAATTAPLTVWKDRPHPSAVRTLRYLGVFTAVRAVFVATNAQGAIRVARDRLSVRRG